MDLVKLSASRLKTLQNCSWLYNAQYVLKIPSSSNDGANRGTVVHLIFELCAKKKHKHLVSESLKLYKKNKKLPTCLERLILKKAKKLSVDDEDNLEMIREMIYVGFNYDFLCKGSKHLESEIEFDINNGKYHIGGFIDKRAIYPDNSIVIWDYKSSKEKFSQEELDGNLQNLMYCLASYKQTGEIPSQNFLFLRFPDSPEQKAPKPTVKDLKGFEYYLENMSFYLKDYNYEKATSNFAYDKKDKMWLCGFAKTPNQLKKDGSPMWYCAAKFPFNYWVLCDEDGNILSSKMTKEELPKPKKNEFIIEKQYHGCPRHNHLFS